MKFHEMKIAGLDRKLPLLPLTDELYIAGFVMFGDAELTVICAEKLLEKAPDFDVIVTAEAKGIPIAHEMSRQSGKPYVVFRKAPKLYMVDVISTEVNSITTENVQTLCVGAIEAEEIRGKRVLVVDDVISTGESLAAIERLVNQLGGTVVTKMAVLAEGDALKREDIIYLDELTLFTPEGEPIRNE